MFTQKRMHIDTCTFSCGSSRGLLFREIFVNKLQMQKGRKYRKQLMKAAHREWSCSADRQSLKSFKREFSSPRNLYWTPSFNYLFIYLSTWNSFILNEGSWLPWLHKSRKYHIPTCFNYYEHSKQLINTHTVRAGEQNVETYSRATH